MNFGVPNQRRRSTKVEKYPNRAVVTLVIAEEGKSRSMLFNDKAVELLDLAKDATVAFAFENGGIFLVNATGSTTVPEPLQIRVTKSEPRKISDKKTYDYIIKTRELNNAQENEFELVSKLVDGINVLEFVSMKADKDVANVEDNSQESDITEFKTSETSEFSDEFVSNTVSNTVDDKPFSEEPLPTGGGVAH